MSDNLKFGDRRVEVFVCAGQDIEANRLVICDERSWIVNPVTSHTDLASPNVKGVTLIPAKLGDSMWIRIEGWADVAVGVR